MVAPSVVSFMSARAGGPAGEQQMSIGSVEERMTRSLRAEALRLQIEHRAIAPVQGHQFGVRAELDDLPLLEHADPIDMTNGREPV